MFLAGVFLLFLLKIQFSKSFVIQKVKTNGILKAQPESSCLHKTYCENTAYYPTDVIVDALANNPYLRDFANADEMDGLLQRNVEPEEESLCVATEQIIFPKLGLTKNSTWMYIMNHENFTQSIRIETCLEENKPCRVIDGFAEGYYTKCKQKYIYRQLLAISEDGTLNRESFRFPASCCCHIEFQADKFLRSFGSMD